MLARGQAARIGRARFAWGPDLVALLIAATLGLLSPLSCVIHCAIHGHPAAPAAVAAHAGGHGSIEHMHAPGPAPEHGAPVGRPDPGVEEPVTPPTPRALYELLGLAAASPMGDELLLGPVDTPPYLRLRPLPAEPATPPPRLA